MKKCWKFIAGVLCTTLIACSCVKKPEEKPVNPNSSTTENDTQDKLNVLKPMAYSSVEGLNLEPGSYISIIGRYHGDSYWSEIEAGAGQAVSDINDMLGYKGDDKIQLNYVSPNKRDDIEEQISILDEELDLYPIAVGIAMIDASACKVQFDLAAENGTPIIAFDSVSDYHGVAATCSTNNLNAGKTAAVHLASSIDENGEIAIFVQDSKSTTAKEREEGFVNEIAVSHPNISIVKVYHLDELDTVAEQIAQEMNAQKAEDDETISAASLTQKDVVKYIIDTHPNLKAIFATNLDTTQLVADVVTNMQKNNLKIVGFDGGEEQVELLENGTLEGLIIQNPYAMGYATVVAGARAALGLPNESPIDSGFTWVTRASLGESSIQKMLY